MRSLFFVLSMLTASLAGSVPAEPTGVQTITTPNNITIRYKEPGKEGVCETTPGVKSYSGYVDLSPTSHTFFYFFEARHDPQNAPITLWLNGGPGSDSLIGLFQGISPCNIVYRICAWILVLIGRTWPMSYQFQQSVLYQPAFVE